MSYRELLEKYSEDALDEERKKQVEEDIEKHEAISDYLCENGEIPDLKEVFEEEQDKSGKEKEADFVSLINQSVHKAFVKLGAAVLAVTLAAVLFIQFCLPYLVSAFFYNPARGNGNGDNQMSRDMAVYTELLIPCMRRDMVTVDAKGYGKYDFNVHQVITRTGKFTSVPGEIVRGNIKYYNPDILNPPSANCFVWYQAVGDLSKPLTEGLDEQRNSCAAGKRTDSLNILENLDDKEYYIGYVSLNQMMDYEAFIKYLDSKAVDDAWCAVKTKDIEEYDKSDSIYFADNLGFNCSLSSSTSLQWDEEKYPELYLWQTNEDGDTYKEAEEKIKSEEDMQVHFTSLLNYMADQERFLNMMGKAQELFRGAADYVKENGIKVYGFAAVMTKDTALELSQDEEVYEIYTEVFE